MGYNSRDASILLAMTIVGPSSKNISDVKITLLLAGGHQQTLYLKPDTPDFKNLFAALLNRAQHPSGHLFQIPVSDGRASLCFPVESLIGLITEPPFHVQAPGSPQSEPFYPLPAPYMPGNGTPSSMSQASEILPSKSAQIDRFLSPDERHRLLSFTFEREEEFVPTTTSTGAADYRSSLVLYAFQEFQDIVTDRIKAIFPDILRKLEMPEFPIAQVEAQLTSHNNGDFYKVHNDNGSPDTATRELTYVYYYYRQPKPFEGGELRIYDSVIRNNYYAKAESFHTVEPRDNSIVFFPSRYLHEVLPIRCESKAFADGRFTINGWIRRP